MEAMSAINVMVDSKDKEIVTNILKDLGLNMSTLINMTLKQVIKNDGIPFEIRNPRPSKELQDALIEADEIEEKYNDGLIHGCKSISELKRAIDD